MKNYDEILQEIKEAAYHLEADGAESNRIIILSPKKFIDKLFDEFEKMTGDKINREDKMTLFGCKVFPSFENKITVYDEYIVEDFKRFPIKIKLY
ncbi:MAG TPA: hypothetical protein VFM82_03645 [Flavobacteriaceae bacterium]|nr:hypothetical protein [Flavobacteriaceae bacterium]